MTCTIRYAKQEDEAIIHRFISELEGFTMDVTRFHERYLHNLSQPDVIYLVALENERVIGFLSAHGQVLLHHEGKAFEIQELFVERDERSKGIGQLLIGALQKELEDRPHELLEVTSNKVRTDTHRFYLRTGFAHTHYKFTLPFKK